MPVTQMQNPHTFQSKQIKVHCPECAVRLCDRKLKEDTWFLHIKRRFIEHARRKTAEIFAKEIFIKCRDCGTWHKITADEGIVESSKNGTGI